MFPERREHVHCSNEHKLVPPVDHFPLCLSCSFWYMPLFYKMWSANYVYSENCLACVCLYILGLCGWMYLKGGLSRAGTLRGIDFKSVSVPYEVKSA
jgi:hypothetical protein